MLFIKTVLGQLCVAETSNLEKGKPDITKMQQKMWITETLKRCTGNGMLNQIRFIEFHCLTNVLESEEIWKDVYIEFWGWQEKSERQVYFAMVTSKSPLLTFDCNLCHKLATFRLPRGIFVKHLCLNQDIWKKFFKKITDFWSRKLQKGFWKFSSHTKGTFALNFLCNSL